MERFEFIDKVLAFRKKVLKKIMRSAIPHFAGDMLNAYIRCFTYYGVYVNIPIMVTCKGNIVIDSFTGKTYPLTKGGMIEYWENQRKHQYGVFAGSA